MINNKETHACLSPSNPVVNMSGFISYMNAHFQSTIGKMGGMTASNGGSSWSAKIPVYELKSVKGTQKYTTYFDAALKVKVTGNSVHVVVCGEVEGAVVGLYPFGSDCDTLEEVVRKVLKRGDVESDLLTPEIVHCYPWVAKIKPSDEQEIIDAVIAALSMDLFRFMVSELDEGIYATAPDKVCGETVFSISM